LTPLIFADTHCHLDFNTFTSDRAEVLARAQHVGVNRFLNPGIDIETSQTAITLADAHHPVYAAVGVHPNAALSWDELMIAQLRKMAEHPKVVAIGEIGLDYYRDRSPKELQQQVFRAQLALAADLQLPVIIHCRQAIEDTLAILAAWHEKLKKTNSHLLDIPGVMHSFEGNKDDAIRAINMDFFIGVSGPITFKNASQRKEVISAQPLERLLLETDSPFLTPDPHRGKRNEPAYIPLISETIAALHSIKPSSVAEQTSMNAARLFAWSS
jgi:TatD DNase family protein